MIYGVDIGGTKIEISVFDNHYNPSECWRIKTPTSNYKEFLNTIANLVAEADIRHATKGRIGLGMPGLVDKNGASLSANVPAANGRRVAADLAEKIDRPVVCENDAHCFALSEAVGGAGARHHSVYGAILGTGVAGGFVKNGQLLNGRQGLAGESGHQPISAPLQQKYNLPLYECGCGLTGCYETYIAGPGLKRLHKHLCGELMSTRAIAIAWKAGDGKAINTMNCYLDIVGSWFATLVLAYDPDIIVMGGGVSLIDGLIDNIPAATKQHLFKGFSAPPIVRAKFGDASGARGAAILAAGGH